MARERNWERHYYLVNCSKHGQATAMGCGTMTGCARCDWERARGIRRGKVEIVEITKEEYQRREDEHWFALFGTHRYPLP